MQRIQKSAVLRWIARRCLYYNWGPAIPFPRSRVAPFEEVWLTAADGVRLHARWYPCPPEFGLIGVPIRPTVLFFHGNAGTVRRWRHIGSRWQDAIGADVLVVDYRGYGRSEGRPTEPGLRLDSRAAHDWLMTRGCDPNGLVICGQSLGGGVAVELATSGVDHAALVLESTFTSVRDVADGLLWNRIPFGKLLDDEFPSLARLRGYERPLFVSHGDRDRLIPIAHAEQLTEVAAGPSELLVLPGMGHPDKRPASYGETVREFLGPHLRADG